MCVCVYQNHGASVNVVRYPSEISSMFSTASSDGTIRYPLLLSLCAILCVCVRVCVRMCSVCVCISVSVMYV